MKNRNLVIAFCLFFSLIFCSRTSAQNSQITDSSTSQVGALYLVDSSTFATKTGYVYKRVYYTDQFLKQPAPDTASSFVVKKEKVAVGSKYFLKNSTTGKLEPVFVLAEFNYEKKSK